MSIPVSKRLLSALVTMTIVAVALTTPARALDRTICIEYSAGTKVPDGADNATIRSRLSGPLSAKRWDAEQRLQKQGADEKTFTYKTGTPSCAHSHSRVNWCQGEGYQVCGVVNVAVPGTVKTCPTGYILVRKKCKKI